MARTTGWREEHQFLSPGLATSPDNHMIMPSSVRVDDQHAHHRHPL